MKSDKKAFIELMNFECGGASGCYDLGSIITQIIHQMGENNFIKMTESLNSLQKSNLISYIKVGLEYGFQLNKNSTNKDFKNQFPKLYRKLNNIK